MFFTLGPDIDDRFNQHHRIGNFWFSHDAGWIQTSSGWTKGYGDNEFGNWCSLNSRGDTVVLDHDQYRSFPLWWDGKSLTNLLGTGKNIWADDRVIVTPDGLETHKVDVIGTIPDMVVTKDHAVDVIAKRLENNLRWLLDNLLDHPKKIFLTGGTDTAVIYAVMKYLKLDFETIDYEYFKYDWFTNHNITNIRKQHWAYRQIHHWTDSCVFVTGSCGDEFLFRGPEQIAIWAAWNDIDLERLLRSSDGYHRAYFLADKNLSLIKTAYSKRNEIREKYPTRPDLLRKLLDSNINDHQHWHLGKTLTYTPFKDLELTKVMLSLSPDDLLGQILDAEINRRLIERFCPECNIYMSSSKNYNHRRSLNA